MAAEPRDPAAYDLYLRRRFFFNRRAAPKAIEAFEAALARDPTFAAAHTRLLRAGARDRPSRHARPPGPRPGRSSSYARGTWAEGLAAAGRRDEARVALAELSASDLYVSATHVVNAQLRLGDREAALASLARAVEERNAVAWWWVRHEPGLTPLRADPGFPALAAGVTPAS